MALLTTTFLTDALKRPVTVNVIVPTDKMVCPDDYLPEKAPMKTLYLLEGLTGAFNGASCYSKIQNLAEDHNLCVVMVGGDNKWYADSDTSGDHYGDLIVKDLIHFTRQTFNLSCRREDTYIGGFSMGGFGAFTNGLRHPELFSRIIAMDSALNKNVILNAREKAGSDMFNSQQYRVMFDLADINEYENSDDDYEFLAEQVARSENQRPDIFISCGKEDGLLPLNTAYKDFLVSLGYNVTYVEFEGLAHSFAALDAGLTQALDWLPLDDFRGNIIETGPEQNFGYKEYINWKVYQNL